MKGIVAVATFVALVLGFVSVSRAQAIAYRTDMVEGAAKPILSAFVVGTRVEMLAFNWNTAGGGRELRWIMPIRTIRGVTPKIGYAYLPDLRTGCAVPWVAYRARFDMVAVSSDFGALVPIKGDQPARFLMPETSALVSIDGGLSIGVAGSVFKVTEKPIAVRIGPMVRFALPLGFTTRGWYGFGVANGTLRLIRLELARRF